MCVGKLCVGKLCVGKLCVSELCVGKLCVGKLCVWRRGGGKRKEKEADGSAQPKTRTPHNDVGKKHGGIYGTYILVKNLAFLDFPIFSLKATH